MSLLNQSYTELKKYVSFSVANGHRIESAPVQEKEEEESDVCSAQFVNAVTRRRYSADWRGERAAAERRKPAAS